MADQKPTENNTEMLGGINTKVSDYTSNKKQFQNIRNMDFDVPNALQKRPGSTQAISAGISGAVTSLHEFVRLDGASVIVAGSDTAMWYLTGQTANLLDSGWSNGQPADLLTFVNKEYMANGSKFYGWSGIGATPYPVGLPMQASFYLSNSTGGPGTASNFSVFGYTMGSYSGLATGARVHVWAAVSYVRADGLFGPLNIINSARTVGPESLATGETIWSTPAGSADYGNDATLPINVFGGAGFTAPAGYGITAAALFLLVDTGVGMSLTYGIARSKGNLAGTSLVYTNPLLKTDTPPYAFKFFTLLPISAVGQSGIYIYGASNWLFSQPPSFSAMTFDWFFSNTPKYLEINQNSMFMAGFSGAPSTIWFSNLGVPEVIESDSFFEVRTNDGDRIFGTKTFNNNVLVFKQNSFHKVIGDSPENFELVELSNEYGCISNQAIVEYRELLVWLDQKGVVRYNGASWEIISTPVEEIFKRMNLEAAKEKACAFHNLYRNQIWFGIPVDGSTQNNVTVVYDYLVDAWTYFDGFNPASFTLAKGSLNKPTAWRGDYSGLIHYHGESFFGDNGRGITCLAMPNWDRNKPNETWIWRRFFLDVATVTGLTGTITGKVMSDYDHTTVQATYSIYQNAFQSRAELGVVAKAVTTEWAHYSASLPLLINNYAWAKRLLRNV